MIGPFVVDRALEAQERLVRSMHDPQHHEEAVPRSLGPRAPPARSRPGATVLALPPRSRTCRGRRRRARRTGGARCRRRPRHRRRAGSRSRPGAAPARAPPAPPTNRSPARPRARTATGSSGSPRRRRRGSRATPTHAARCRCRSRAPRRSGRRRRSPPGHGSTRTPSRARRSTAGASRRGRARPRASRTRAPVPRAARRSVRSAPPGVRVRASGGRGPSRRWATGGPAPRNGAPRARWGSSVEGWPCTCSAIPAIVTSRSGVERGGVGDLAGERGVGTGVVVAHHHHHAIARPGTGRAARRCAPACRRAPRVRPRGGSCRRRSSRTPCTR